MKFREYLEDLILDSKLFEMAFSRREVESKITELGYPIFLHLIKILKWKDDLNYKKHLGDINSWFLQIEKFKMKNGQRPKQRDYYQWLFYDVVEDERTVVKNVRGLYKYQNLDIIRTDKEVFDCITNILFEISKDLAIDKYNNIEDYIE